MTSSNCWATIPMPYGAKDFIQMKSSRLFEYMCLTCFLLASTMHSICWSAGIGCALCRACWRNKLVWLHEQFTVTRVISVAPETATTPGDIWHCSCMIHHWQHHLDIRDDLHPIRFLDQWLHIHEVHTNFQCQVGFFSMQYQASIWTYADLLSLGTKIL